MSRPSASRPHRPSGRPRAARVSPLKSLRVSFERRHDLPQCDLQSHLPVRLRLSNPSAAATPPISLEVGKEGYHPGFCQVQTIQPFASEVVEVILTKGAGWAPLSSAVSVKLSRCDGFSSERSRQVDLWEKSLRGCLGGLQRLAPLEHPDRVRIGIFGGAGTGKTSLINAIFSLLSYSDEPLYTADVEASYQDENIATTTQVWPLDHADLPLNVEMVEMTSMTIGDKQENEKDFVVVNGASRCNSPQRVPTDTDVDKDDDEPAKLVGVPDSDVDCAVFLLSLREALCADWDTIKNAMSRSQIGARKPLVVLSHLREVDEELRRHPASVTASLNKARFRVAKELQCPLSRVLWMVPYTDECSRTFEIDQITYRILEHSIKHAVTRRRFCRRRRVSTEKIVHAVCLPAESLQAVGQSLGRRGKRCPGLRCAVVLKDYTAQDETEMTLAKGDIIRVLTYPPNAPWWTAQTEKGRTFKFPNDGRVCILGL